MQHLLQYIELLNDWNQVFNLTSITKPKDVLYLHLIDSLLIAPYLKGPHCLDVGSGGGFPGVPLAIYCPSLSWYLLDKNSKKTRFLTQVVAELKLFNTKVVHTRAEDFAQRKQFDTILSRAFGTLPHFIAATRHLLKDDGQFLAMKGKIPNDEIAALPKDIARPNIIKLTMHGATIERHLIQLKLTGT